MNSFFFCRKKEIKSCFIYSFKELKEYLAYLTIEGIVKNTQKKAEVPLSREEIIGLIKEYYMYEEEYDIYV